MSNLNCQSYGTSTSSSIFNSNDYFNDLLKAVSSLPSQCIKFDPVSSTITNVPQDTNKNTEKSDNMFDKILGCIQNEKFRVSINGNIAVKTNNGYKTFDVETNELVNCSDFIFDIGDEWFFTVPATKVKKGDIIIVNNVPKCVISVGELIKVLNFENSVVEEIVPEHHLFMGKAYFYTKVVSMFGSSKTKKPFKQIMKWRLMSQLFKGNNGNGFEKMMMYKMFMSDKDEEDDIFGDIFDFEE